MADVPGLRPAGAEATRAALAASSDLGMLFRLADPADGPAEESGGWRPVSALYSDAGYLDEILDTVRAGFDQCEPRVAASVFFQGYAARLLSPQLACAAARQCAPEMSPERLCWRRPGTEMIQLGMSAGDGWLAPADTLIEHIVRVSFDDHLQPLADLVLARIRLAAAVLIDNAASALINGLWLLADRFGYFRSDWRSLAAHALRQPRLHGSGTIPPRPPVPLFVRRSCCLAYRIPGWAKCGDCPLEFYPDGRRRERRGGGVP